MFKNVGERILKAAKSVFVGNVAFSIIFGFLLWIADPWESLGFGFVWSLLISLAGVSIAKIIRLFMQGFGKITQYCEFQIMQIQGDSEEGCVNSSATEEVIPHINPENLWICSCGRVNENNAICICGRVQE